MVTGIRLQAMTLCSEYAKEQKQGGDYIS